MNHEGVSILRTIPAEIWRAYEATMFCTTVDGEDIRIRPGDIDASLERALEARGATTRAYVTAWNPGSQLLSRSENDLRQRSLKDELERRGFEIAEGRGEPADATWEPEASVLIFGIDEADAVALGVEHGQGAIVVGERGGGPARLVPCCGESATSV